MLAYRVVPICSKQEDCVTKEPIHKYDGDKGIYRPSLHVVLLQLEAWDYPDSSSAGGYDSFSFQVHITAANDPPSLRGPTDNGFVGKEDTKLILNADGGIILLDPDEKTMKGGMLEVKVTVGTGNLHLPLSFAGGLYLLSGDQPRGSNQFWARGGLADLTRSLQRLEYRAPADWSGTDELDVWVTDFGEEGEGGGLEATASFDILIEPVNDKPKLHYPSTVHYLDEDTSCAIGFIRVSDPDPASLLTLRLQPENGVIQFPSTVLEEGQLDNVEIAHIGSADRGQAQEQQALTLRGQVPDLDSAVQLLMYSPPTDFTGQVAVQIWVTDETGLTADINIYFYVRPVNDPPVMKLRGVGEHTSTLVITAGGTGDPISGVVISDIDVDDSSDLCTNMLGVEGRKALSLKFAPSAGIISIREKEAVGVRVVDASTAGPGETLFLQGSVRWLQAALDGGHLLYRAPTIFSGTDVVLVTVADGGNCGAGGAKSTKGTLEVHVPPYNPPLVVEFGTFTSDGGVLLTHEDQPFTLPDVIVKGGSVGERAAVEAVVIAVSGNLTLHESYLSDVDFIDGTKNGARRLHLRGSPAALTHALSDIRFNPRRHFFGYWNRNGSQFDDTPVRSPRVQGALALARVDIVATPYGGGTQVAYEDSRIRPNAAWSVASVKISVGWLNDPPTVDAPRLIVAQGFEESPVPRIRVADPDVTDAPGGRGRLEVNVSTARGGTLSVDAMIALVNGLRDEGLGDTHVRLRGQPEYVNNALATLLFKRANTTEGKTFAKGDIVDTLLIEVSDLGFSGAGGENRANASVIVEAGVAKLNAPIDMFALEKILPLVSTSEGSAVALPGLETRSSVTDDVELVTVSLSAREGYLSLGPAGQGVAVAGANEDWGPAVTIISTSGNAEQTLPEVQVGTMRTTCRQFVYTVDCGLIFCVSWR